MERTNHSPSGHWSLHIILYPPSGRVERQRGEGCCWSGVCFFAALTLRIRLLSSLACLRPSPLVSSRPSRREGESSTIPLVLRCVETNAQGGVIITWGRAGSSRSRETSGDARNDRILTNSATKILNGVSANPRACCGKTNFRPARLRRVGPGFIQPLFRFFDGFLVRLDT